MLTPEEAGFVTAICSRLAGLRVDPRKLYPIETRLAPLARREGLASVSDLINRLRKGEERLVWHAVEAMAQAETAFFRDNLPFEQFRDQILPALAKVRGEEPVNVWSAGCATGQEAYSLAMCAEQAGVRIRLLGSDISESSLRKAQGGLYTQFEIQRGLPARMLVEHFEKDGETWMVNVRLRHQVRWRRINLIGDLSAMPKFDVIFCRNLIVGLEDQAAAKVAANLAEHLTEEGVLVTGLKDVLPASASDLSPIAGRPGLYRHAAANREAA